MDYWRGIYSLRLTEGDYLHAANGTFLSLTSVLHGPYSGDDIARIKAGIA